MARDTHKFPPNVQEVTQSSAQREIEQSRELSRPEPQPQLEARDGVTDWAQERMGQYKAGLIVERLGHDGLPEQWTIASVDARGTTFLVNKEQKAAIMHATEVALEERAAVFGPHLHACWNDTIKLVRLTEDEDWATVQFVLTEQQGDIMYLAAERMAAKPDADPAKELLKAIMDVKAAVYREHDDALRTHETVAQRVEHAAAELVDGEIYLSHLRFGASTGIDSDKTPARGHGVPQRAKETGEKTDPGQILHVTPEQTATTRARIAEVTVGAPALAEQILDGKLTSTPETPHRSIEEIDAEIRRLDSDIGFIESQWKLYGKGNKNDAPAAVYLSRIRSMRAHVERLTVERRAAVIAAETPQQRTEKLDKATQRMRALWERTLVDIYKKRDAEAPTALLFRRELNFGANPNQVAHVLDRLVASDGLHPTDADECRRLLKTLRQESLPTNTGDDEITLQLPVTPEPEPEPTVIHTPARKKPRPRTIPRGPIPYAVGGKVLSAPQESPHAQTASPDAPVNMRFIEDPAILKERSQKKEAEKSRRSGRSARIRSRVEENRKAAQKRAARGELTPLQKKNLEEQELLDQEYRPPERIEANYRPFPQVRVPERKLSDLDDDAWFAEGERVQENSEAIPTIESGTPRSYTEPFRKFAKDFGGPQECVRHYHEAKAKTNLIKFSLEDLRHAGPVRRWWYARQLRTALAKLLQQESHALAARKRRGKLQS